MPETESKNASPLHIETLLRKLGSKDTRKRKDAERAVQALGTEAIEPALTLLDAEIQNHRKRQKVFGTAFRIILSIALASITFLFLKHDPHPILMSITVMVSLIVVLGPYFQAALAPSRLQDALAEYVQMLDDVRCLGPILDMLPTTVTALPPAVGRMLMRLLPRLQTSDAHIFNRSRRDHLNSLLLYAIGNSRRVELLLAILKALEQVGDASALSLVESIAEPGRTFLTKESIFKEDRKRVEEAAENCLVFLRQRAEQDRFSSTLLRPSDVVDRNSETLLRPAQGSSDDAPETLLRSTSQE